MTVSELANKLNTTVSEIFEHYKKILVDIPQDENYVLTAEQVKRAIPNYKAAEDSENTEFQTEKLSTTRLEDIKSRLEERRAKRVEILDNLEPFFKKGESPTPGPSPVGRGVV